MHHLNQLYLMSIPLCITGGNAETTELSVIDMKKYVKKEMFSFHNIKFIK